MSSARLQSLLQSALGHHKAGRLAAAEAFYKQARALAPRHFDVLHLSGLVAYQEGRMSDAVDLLGRACQVDPKSVAAIMRLGLAQLGVRRVVEAEMNLRRAVELKPDFQEAWDNLAYFLKTQNRLPEALACHEKSVTLGPGSAASWYNFGLSLSLCGRFAEALGCHERALTAEPGFAKARFGRAQALQQLHRIAEAVDEYDRFLLLQPGHHEARSYRLMALHYLDRVSREQLFAEHQAFGRAVGAAPANRFAQAAVPDRRLRVAFLSPDLRSHSISYFLAPLLQHLDRRRFEVVLYHDHFCEDAVSQQLRALASVWRNFVGQPAPVVEATIRADAPDILVDLAGHTGLNRLPLLARRLAPVQVTYLGYPNTTGVAALDYRFTDAIVDPEGEADAFATERLVRFAPTAWAYSPRADAPPVGPTPALTAGRVTFGCFNNPAKITDAVLQLWARVLDAVPGSRLRLKGDGFGQPAVRARYEERLGRCGISVSRVDLLELTATSADHLALYQTVDVAFDTFPYHGTTTTCEALWMGVPVVTLAGNDHRSRVGASLLAAVGHAGWCARTPEEFVGTAVELARDPAALNAIRLNLRPAMAGSPLLDHAGQAERFGTALRAAWVSWCAPGNRRAA